MAAHTAWQGREWPFVISPFFFFSNKGMGQRGGGGRGVGRREILGTGSLTTGNRLAKKRKRLFVLEHLILAV